MKQLLLSLSLLLGLGLTAQPCGAADMPAPDRMIHHDIQVDLDPENHGIKVKDRITVPAAFLPEFGFFLHSGFAPTTAAPGVRLSREGREVKNVPVELYSVRLPPGVNSFIIEYSGTINHPLAAEGSEYSRGFMETPGLISAEGVYLGGSSYWYPSTDGAMLSFTLDVKTPPAWDSVSQGERTFHEKRADGVRAGWDSPEPQDEIFLVAGRFSEYQRRSDKFSAMVFLRQPDEKLAADYLDAALKYAGMYEGLIGPYPYRKFALVENFWETGYGMPSFTLMGPRIIRFPFILHSSFPHEILHNWWGNSVFPDYSSGNWSEGLTAYLSDHLIKEQRGAGAEYRQTALQKYADYVSSGRDFPLKDFTSRHNSSSEAVGYGKSLMFFHMMRQELGDHIFKKGLRHFYKNNKFRYASFGDLQKSLEEISGKELDFDQWVARAGAPEIRLDNASVEKEGTGFALKARLSQIQHGGPYRVKIPLAVTLEAEENAFQSVVEMEDKTLELKLNVPARPVRIDVDPEFDLFRRLDRDEIPPALSQALGSQRMLILLPSSAEGPVIEAYRKLADSIGRSGPGGVETKLDSEVKSLPSNMSVTILGWENRFRKDLFDALAPYDVTIEREGVKVGEKTLPRDKHSLVFTGRHPENRDLALTFIASHPIDAIPGLARKLPHYHKYSYLAFEGEEPANILKGRWPVLDSPMTAFFRSEDGTASRAEMPKLGSRRPLAEFPPSFSDKEMLDAIAFLSGAALKGRELGSEGLDIAADYIARKFMEAGLQPAGDEDGSYFQQWSGPQTECGSAESMKNVVGVIPGSKPEFAGQSVVVGAHYDHLGEGLYQVREERFRGMVHHGADDNASGVSVLIQLAAYLNRGFKPERTIVFIAFTGEESGRIGSGYYVSRQKRYSAGKCMAMLNLDTVGRLGKNRLLVLGSDSAAEWPHIVRGAGYVTGIETDMVPEQLDSSDHTSFLEAGVPAVQLFTGPHLDYHRPSDTVEKIDSHGLVKVASFAKEIIEYLSHREKPLSIKTGIPGDKPEKQVARRKSSLGIIPDFAFKGKGCRLSGVVPGSPAESGGLMEGDVITGINAAAVSGLRDLSDLLKSLSPGDRVSITFTREGRTLRSEATLAGR